ncbi:MAG: hotdog fold thioesterase, partial [Paludibacter sp.]
MPHQLSSEELNNLCKNTMIDHLGIEFIEASKGFIIARMPVDKRTIQPMKRLHGGASMALAETVGSAGSMMLVDPKHYAV